jgi:uncharacterized low-complexity protein
MNKTKTSLSLGSAFLATATLALSAQAGQTGYSAQPLDKGYQVAAADMDKKADGACGAAKKADGSCGAAKGKEGSCGASKPHAGKKRADGKCGEGKCGAASTPKAKMGLKPDPAASK